MPLSFAKRGEPDNPFFCERGGPSGALPGAFCGGCRPHIEADASHPDPYDDRQRDEQDRPRLIITTFENDTVEVEDFEGFRYWGAPSSLQHTSGSYGPMPAPNIGPRVRPYAKPKRPWNTSSISTRRSWRRNANHRALWGRLGLTPRAASMLATDQLRPEPTSFALCSAKNPAARTGRWRLRPPSLPWNGEPGGRSHPHPVQDTEERFHNPRFRF